MDIVDHALKVAFAAGGYALHALQQWLSERPALEWHEKASARPGTVAYGEMTVRNRAARRLRVRRIEVRDPGFDLRLHHGFYASDVFGHAIDVDTTLAPHGTGLESEATFALNVMLAPGESSSGGSNSTALGATCTILVRAEWTTASLLAFKTRSVRRLLRLRIHAAAPEIHPGSPASR